MKKRRKYKLGGKFKQYNTKSHKNGGLLLDANGNPIKGKTKPVAEIEKQESILKSNGSSYVFSDSLGTAQRAKKILGDFPKDQPLDISARRNAFSKLKRLNELKRDTAMSARANKIYGSGLSSSRSKAADKLYEKELGGDIVTGVLGAAAPFIEELKNDDNLYNNFSNSASDLIPKMAEGSFLDPDPINTETYDGKLALFNNDPSKHHLDLIGKTRRDAANPVPDKLDSLNINPVEQGLIGANLLMRPDRSDMPQNDPNKLPGTNVGKPKVPEIPTLKDASVRGSTFFDRLKEKSLDKSDGLDRASILRGVGTVGSAISAFRGADKETPRFTDFRAGDKLVEDVGIDPQALINESNLAFNTGNYLAKESSRTSSQYFNRLRANTSRAGQAAAQLELDAKKYNDSTSLSLAGREDRKSAANAAEQIRIDTANSQNAAVSKDLQQQFLNTMYDTGTALDKKRYLEEATTNMNEAQKRQFVLNLAMLSQNSTNFKIDSKAMENFIKNYDSFDTNTIINELVKYTDNGE